MKPRTSKRIAAVTLALLAAAQLAGCGSDSKPSRTPTPPGHTGGSGGGGNPGGGSGGGGDTGGGTPGVLAEGFFVDAAVAGLSYSTSSNITGVTDAAGRYKYRDGDTVTFSIGGLTLGTVVGQGVVTPVTVAQAIAANSSGADAETIAVNLLVLLQSLDANGDPDDGIAFTTEIREAVTTDAIDFTASVGAFSSSLTNLVAAVSAAAPEATLQQVTREQAIAHFESQGPAALAGMYVRANEDFAPIVQKAVTLAIFTNGRYLLGGQHASADCNLGAGLTADNALAFSDANGNGIEYGAYNWNPLDNTFGVAGIIRETDGTCGFNVPVVDATNDITVLEPHAKGLVFKDGEGNVIYRFARLQREALTLAGGWLAPTALLHGQPFMFTFFPSSEDGLTGRYLMVDASVPNLEEEASPGIEEGCYRIDANDNLTIDLDAASCADAVDTNETAGVSNADAGLKLFIDENDRLVIDDGEFLTSFTRLPAPAITHEAMAGAWILERTPGLAPALDAQLMMLTIFEDGRFLLGGQENDESCTPHDYPTWPLAADGNGVEYGRLSLTTLPGLVVPTNVTVDTNGECGLYHNGKEIDGVPFQQAYFVAPNAAGDTLVIWANEEDDPAGIVFKRVPSVPNQIWGAWKWSMAGATADQFAVSAYLQGGPHDGVMFEVSTLPDDDKHVGVGILRESFKYDGTTMLSYAAGYAYCIDTQGEEDNCQGDPEPVEEKYTVNGDWIGDEADGVSRIPDPTSAP